MAPDQVNGLKISRFSELVSIEVGDKCDLPTSGQAQDETQDCARPLNGAHKFTKYGACEPVASEQQLDKAKNERKLVDQASHLEEGANGRAPRRAHSSDASSSGARDNSEDDDAAQLEWAAGKQQLSLVERLAKVIPGLGIMLALCASVSLGTAGMLVKLTTSVHGIQVAVFRAVIQMIIYSAIISLRKLGWRPARNELVPVCLRAILGGTSITFSYYALKLIPLGDATTIRFSLPIWTLIMSYFFLGESCSLFKVCAVIISVAGVVLIAKPDECVYLAHLLLNALKLEPDAELEVHARDYERARVDEIALLVESSSRGPVGASLVGGLAAPNSSLLSSSSAAAAAGSWPDTSSYVLLAAASPAPPTLQVDELRQFEGCMMALASSICLSLSLIALRLCKQTPAEITILWLSLFSVLIGSVTLLLLNEWRLPNNLEDLLFILLNGLCGSIGQWFITSALKVEQSGIISLARTFDIEIAFLYSALLLGERIRPTSILGSVMVSLGVIIVVVPRLFKSSTSTSTSTTNSNSASQPNSDSNSDTSAATDAAAPEHEHERDPEQGGQQQIGAPVTSQSGGQQPSQPGQQEDKANGQTGARTKTPPDEAQQANGHS